MILQRFFGAPKTTTPRPAKKPLPDIQHSLRDALTGCNGVSADRLFYKIDVAQTPADLWALRSDLHQCIAQVHSEGIAAQRINQVNAVFAGWIPSAQRLDIQPDFKPSKG